MSSKKLKGSQLKTFRSAVARLKSMGLVSKRVDARKQKSTRYMRDQVEKRFADVLAGKAYAVKVSKRSEREKYKQGFDVKRRYVIVPVEPGSSRPVYRKKAQQIVGKSHMYGRDIERTYTPVSAESIGKLPTGKNYRYSIDFKKGGYRAFDKFAELEAFMYDYENPPKGSKHHRYVNWRNYVIVENVKEDSKAKDYDEDDDI